MHLRFLIDLSQKAIRALCHFKISLDDINLIIDKLSVIRFVKKLEESESKKLDKN